MLALRWGLLLTLLSVFGDEPGYALGEADGTLQAKPQGVDWKIALRKAHALKVQQLDERDSTLEMDAYKNLGMDPAPAAARAAQQAAALDKKMRRMSQKAHEERVLAESGDSVDLGEAQDAGPITEQMVAQADREHKAVEVAATAANFQKNEADVALARQIGIQDPVGVLAAQKAASAATKAATAASMVTTEKLKAMLQKHHSLATSNRDKAKAALDQAIPAALEAERSRSHALHQMAIDQSDLRVHSIQSAIKRAKQSDAARQTTIERLSGAAGVDTEAQQKSAEYEGPLNVEKARKKAQYQAAEAASELTALNRQFLDGDAADDNSKEAESSVELQEASRNLKAAQAKQHQINKALELSVQTSQDKLALAEDESKQLQIRAQEEQKAKVSDEQLAESSKAAAENADKALVEPLQDLRNAEITAKRTDRDLAAQTAALGEANKEKDRVSNKELQALDQESQLLNDAKDKKQHVRDANKIIRTAKAKEEEALKDESVAHAKASNAAKLEQSKEDIVGKRGAIVRRGEQRVSKAKEKMREAKMEAIEAGFAAARTAQADRPTTTAESDLPNQKAQQLVGAVVAKAQKDLSDVELRKQKGEIVDSEEQQQQKQDEAKSARAKQAATAASKEFRSEEAQASQLLQSEQRLAAEQTASAAKAEQFESSIRNAEMKAQHAQSVLQADTAFMKTKIGRLSKDKAVERQAKSAVTDDLSKHSQNNMKIEHLNNALAHARKQAAAAREAAEALYLSGEDSGHKDQVIRTLAEAKFNVHRTERMIQKAQSAKASKSANNVQLKMEASQAASTLSREKEEIASLEASRDAEKANMKGSQAALAKATEDGSDSIQSAANSKIKLQQEQTKLQQKEAVLTQARQQKAVASQSANKAANKVADDQKAQSEQRKTVDNLQIQQNADRMALQAALDKKRALGVSFTKEADAEEALQAEAAALQRSTKREQAMQHAFESAEHVDKNAKAQVALDQSFVSRAYAAQSKLSRAASHEEQQVKSKQQKTKQIEKQLGEVKTKVKKLRELESKDILAGQEALASEVNTKAHVSQATAAARTAKRQARRATHAAAMAGPQLAKTTVQAKHASDAVKQDQVNLEWQRHLAKAEAAVAVKTTQVAQQEFEAATNRSKTSDSAVTGDEDIRQTLKENTAEAKKLLDAATYHVDAPDTSGIVNRQLVKQSAETKAAQAAEEQQAKKTGASQQKFVALDAQSDMAIRKALHAAQKYGLADTTERVALGKLKLTLPEDEARTVDESARKARMDLVETTTDDAKQTEWDTQNTNELERANDIGRRAPAVVTLGEPAEEANDAISLKLGHRLHEAQLELDSGMTKDALDAYYAIPISMDHHE